MQDDVEYTGATTITKCIVAKFNQYIKVYPAVKENGVTNQRGMIRYNCIGAFDVPIAKRSPNGTSTRNETRRSIKLHFSQIGI